jgi:hypothetical protein
MATFLVPSLVLFTKFLDTQDRGASKNRLSLCLPEERPIRLAPRDTKALVYGIVLKPYGKYAKSMDLALEGGRKGRGIVSRLEHVSQRTPRKVKLHAVGFT